MATELTFAPGYVPGIARAPRRGARQVHAAAPVSRSCELAPPMTAEQRRALAWTLTIAAALLPETKLVGSIDVPRVAMPHVTEGRAAAAA